MARGMVNGEAVVSQANTEGFREGYERVFGNRKPQRGRWVWDAKQGRLVDADAYGPEPLALNAPILADRIHEGTVSPIDGSDIGSRRKRREHMRAHGVEDATDITPAFRERQAKQREAQESRSVKAAMESAARKLYAQGKWR